MIYVGIDPGLKGAVAAFDGQLLSVWDTPTLPGKGSKRILDLERMRVIVRTLSHAERFAIERVGARPGQGVTSMFNFGKTYGATVGLVAGRGIAYVEVLPQTWKKHFGLIGKDKNASRELAQKLFPRNAELFARIKDDGRAEAALLARWAAETQQ